MDTEIPISQDQGLHKKTTQKNLIRPTLKKIPVNGLFWVLMVF